jgi:hypothetical protein
VRLVLLHEHDPNLSFKKSLVVQAELMAGVRRGARNARGRGGVGPSAWRLSFSLDRQSFSKISFVISSDSTSGGDSKRKPCGGD